MAFDDLTALGAISRADQCWRQVAGAMFVTGFDDVALSIALRLLRVRSVRQACMEPLVWAAVN